MSILFDSIAIFVGLILTLIVMTSGFVLMGICLTIGAIKLISDQVM